MPFSEDYLAFREQSLKLKNKKEETIGKIKDTQNDSPNSTQPPSAVEMLEAILSWPQTRTITLGILTCTIVMACGKMPNIPKLPDFKPQNKTLPPQIESTSKDMQALQSPAVSVLSGVFNGFGIGSEHVRITQGAQSIENLIITNVATLAQNPQINQAMSVNAQQLTKYWGINPANLSSVSITKNGKSEVSNIYKADITTIKFTISAVSPSASEEDKQKYASNVQKFFELCSAIQGSTDNITVYIRVQKINGEDQVFVESIQQNKDNLLTNSLAGDFYLPVPTNRLLVFITQSWKQPVMFQPQIESQN